jgi:hypothetical protein
MCYIDGQKNKYSVLNECNRMLKYNIHPYMFQRMKSTPSEPVSVKSISIFGLLIILYDALRAPDTRIFLQITRYIKKHRPRDNSRTDQYLSHGICSGSYKIEVKEIRRKKTGLMTGCFRVTSTIVEAAETGGTFSVRDKRLMCAQMLGDCSQLGY